MPQSQETEAEEAAQVFEHFVDGTYHTNVYPSAVLGPTSSFVTPDYPNTYWSPTDDPKRQGEKLALIREVVDAMPEPNMINHLYEVFVTRCQGPLGNVVHTPTFLEQAEVFCGCLTFTSPEEQVTALSVAVSMDTLACHLLAVRMPLQRAQSYTHIYPFYSSCSLWLSTPHHHYLAGLLPL